MILQDLDNVDTANIQEGDVLCFTNGKWVNSSRKPFQNIVNPDNTAEASSCNIVYLEDFGEVGLGINDNLLLEAAVNTGKTIHLSGSLYKFDRFETNLPVRMVVSPSTKIVNSQTSGVTSAAITVSGKLSEFLAQVISFNEFTVDSSGDSNITEIGENLINSLNLSSAYGLSAGDTIRIFEDDGLTLETRFPTGTKPSSQDANHREFITISKVEGNTIYLDEFLRWKYSISKNIKVQKVDFSEGSHITGGNWTGTNKSGGAIEYNFCRNSYSGDITLIGTEENRVGGAPVVYKDCWECDRGRTYGRYTLFTDLTVRNQSCTFGKVSGKRTSNGGAIHGGDQFCHFDEIVQDSPGDDNGDGLGLTNGFRRNTISSFITSGSRCYSLWIHQFCDGNTIQSFSSKNGITGGIYCYSNYNKFKSVDIKGHPSFGLLLGGDYNYAEVDIEVSGTAVMVINNVVGNVVRGMAKSTGSFKNSFDLSLGLNIKNNIIDLNGGLRGVLFSAGFSFNYSNDISLLGKFPYVRRVTRNGLNGYSFSHFITGFGESSTIKVPSSDGSGDNGLIDIFPNTASIGSTYKIYLSLNSTLDDVVSEYRVITRFGGWKINTIHEGSTSIYTPKLRISADGSTLEAYKDIPNPQTLFIRVEKE